MHLSGQMKDITPLTSLFMVTLSQYHGYPTVTMYASGQGMTSDLSFYLKLLCRRSDSLLVWVKFICHAGDTSSCDMVVTVLRDVFSHLFLRLTAAHFSSNLFFSSIVVFFDPLPKESRGFDPCDLCPGNIRALLTLSSSEVVSLMHNHSFTKAFFEVFSIGIYFTSAFILTVCYPFSLGIKCWCGTVAARFFTSCSASQSCPVPFFPPGCTFQVVTTIACCPYHQVRVTSTFDVGKVAKFARLQLLQLLRCSLTH